MSTLWTPGGEHPGGEADDRGGPDAVVGGADPGPAPTDPAMARSLDDLTPEERERVEATMAEMAEVRRQLAEAPVEVVVANHAMGLYELGAIHLSQDPPALEAAKLAIDAMAAVVEGLVGRLGDAEPTLRDALSKLQLAFVQTSGNSGHERADGAS